MPPRRLGAWILALACAAGNAVATRDDSLLAAARAAEPAVIESLMAMVSIESGTMDTAGLARMTDYAERRLQALGLQVERRPSSTGKGEMLIGRQQGSGRRKLMLIAHLDTIYWPGTLATQPIKREGNKLYGLGIADDKGGVAVILHALEILKAAGWRDHAQLTVLLNADEESQSAGSGETIATIAEQHDVVLSYEPTAAKAVAKAEGVLLAAAGTATVTMTVKGRASHAGAAPEQGRNALIELAHQIGQTTDIAKGIAGAQMNWTEASSGKVRNQIPDQATASADLRLTAADAAQRLEAALKAQVAQRKVPDTETSIAIHRPPAVCRRCPHPGAGQARPGDLRRARRPAPDAGARHRGRHRRRVCQPLGQARGAGKPGPGGLGLPRQVRVHRDRFDRAAAVPDDAAADVARPGLSKASAGPLARPGRRRTAARPGAVNSPEVLSSSGPGTPVARVRPSGQAALGDTIAACVQRRESPTKIPPHPPCSQANSAARSMPSGTPSGPAALPTRSR
jgi:glutamate carboxypeptidase